MPRTVYFHIGSAKTGTSAIQVALARNRKLLAKNGLVYPKGDADSRAEQGLVTSGNGKLLKRILRAKKAIAEKKAKARLGEMIKKSSRSSLVFSSEWIASVPPERVAALCELVRASGAEVKIIYYVRHLLDFALSAYNQAVKHAAYPHDLAFFLRKYKSVYVDVIETFSAIVGRQNFIIRLYEKERPNLVGGFVDLLLEQEGIRKGKIAVAADDQEIVNRSLTRRETEVMLFVNNLLRKALDQEARKSCKEISNGILYSLKPAAGGTIVTAEEMLLVEENNRNVPKFVNEFSGGAFELKFKSDDIVIGERAPYEWDETDAVFRSVIATLIEKWTPDLGIVARKASGPLLNEADDYQASEIED